MFYTGKRSIQGPCKHTLISNKQKDKNSDQEVNVMDVRQLITYTTKDQHKTDKSAISTPSVPCTIRSGGQVPSKFTYAIILVNIVCLFYSNLVLDGIAQ